MPKAKLESQIPKASPIFRAWKAHSDEYIPTDIGEHGDVELTSLDPAYLVPFNFRLEPKFITGFFVVPSLTAREKLELEEALGCSLRRRHVVDLNDAVGRFVAGVGLATRIPSWKKFASHLAAVVKRTEELIELTSPVADEAVPRGIVSASEAMNHYLRYRGFQNNLDELKALAQEELKKAQVFASKRGPKGDPSYRLFLESLVVIAKTAGDPLSLPGHEAQGPWGAEKRSTSLSRFANCMIEIACERGVRAAERSSLKAAEKIKARNSFGNLRGKAYDAVLGQLETAREAMMVDEFIDRHPDRNR